MAETELPAGSSQDAESAEQTGRADADASFNRTRDRLDDVALHSVRGPVGRLAAALTEIESLVLRRDVAARFGEPASVAADLERRAAVVACVALDDGVELLDSQLARLEEALKATNVPSVLNFVYEAAQQANERDAMPDTGSWNGASEDLGHRSFRTVESHLLQIAGLAETLADAHVRSALRAFSEQDWSYSLSEHSFHQATMSRYRAGRDAVCKYADQLSAKRGEEREARLARNRLRLVARVAGGALIGGVNVTAAVLFGDLVGAVSAVIGAAASSVNDEVFRSK